MARGTTLTKLLSMFHNEIGQIPSPSYGVGARDSHVNLLQRTQEWLWEDHDWPFLQIKEDINIQAGSDVYDPPPNIPFDRIQHAKVRYGGYWQPVNFGIDEDREYAVYDSDIGVRNDPVRRWDYYYVGDTEQIRFWPIPATNADLTTKSGVVRFTGIKKLPPLVSDSDRAVLDDRMITLFAAAEMLARDRADDAATKLELAEKRYTTLKSNVSSASTFGLGGECEEDEKDGGRIRIRAVYGDTSGA